MVPSIFRHRRVHFIRPRVDPADEVLQLSKPDGAEELHRLGAAAAHAAVHHHLAGGIELRHAFGKLSQRDEDAARYP